MGAPAPVIEEDADPEFLQELQQLFILVLRLGTCSLIVHHGFDKIQNVDGFSANVVAKFFGFLPGPAYFWTYSAALRRSSARDCSLLACFRARWRPPWRRP